MSITNHRIGEAVKHKHRPGENAGIVVAIDVTRVDPILVTWGSDLTESWCQPRDLILWLNI